MSGNAFAQEWGSGWSGRAASARLKDWLGLDEWPFAPGSRGEHSRPGPEGEAEFMHDRHHRHERPGPEDAAESTHARHHRHERPGPEDAAEFMHGPRGRHGRPSPEDIEALMSMRHMRGGGGPFGGPPFGPFGGGPFGGRHGRGRGRARRGDVRVALLLLLAEEPRNGYQLMQEIEERSGGRWRPSPGSVYPTLAQLEDEGLVRASEAEGQRRFEITEAGHAHLETRAEEPAPWEPTDEDGEHPLAELGPLVIQVGKAAWQVASAGDERQRARAIELLAEARRGLYRILAEDPGEGPDETA